MEPREIVSFVKMIKSYPALYNNTLPEYCDKELVDSSWKRVAKAHNVSVSHAKEKWRNIRNGYARSLKPFPDSQRARKPYYLSKVVNFLIPFLKLQGTTVTKNASDCEEDDNNAEIEEYDEDQIYFDEQDTPDENVQVKRRDSSESESQENGKGNIEIQIEEENQEKRSKRSYSEHWNEPVTQISVEPYEQYEPSHSKRGKTVTNHREMFLLSLVPELDKLTDEQMLEFKVKVLTMLSMMLSNSKDALDLNNTM